jgi:hypothetical protein
MAPWTADYGPSVVYYGHNWGPCVTYGKQIAGTFSEDNMR